jgi:prepilin-type N-terminal cleavage/methylation domain-containing protein/prepilin-type processing-associated H-X9-DG protein
MRRAFTLIELLIVIAVVAVLASLLLPAMNRVKDVARSTVCLNNLRGVGSAITTLADNDRGRLPWGFNASWASWVGAVKGLDADARMICPGVKIRNYDKNNFNYTGNLQVLTDKNFGGSKSTLKQVHRLELNPEIPVIFDGSQIAGVAANPNAREMSHNIGATFYYNDNPWLSAAMKNGSPLNATATSFTIDRRHGNGKVANLLFGDGRVVARTPESFTNGDLRIASRGRKYW